MAATDATLSPGPGLGDSGDLVDFLMNAPQSYKFRGYPDTAECSLEEIIPNLHLEDELTDDEYYSQPTIREFHAWIDSSVDKTARVDYAINEPFMKQQTDKETLPPDEVKKIFDAFVAKLKSKAAARWKEMAQKCEFPEDCYDIDGDVTYLEEVMRAAVAHLRDNPGSKMSPLIVQALCGKPWCTGYHTLERGGHVQGMNGEKIPKKEIRKEFRGSYSTQGGLDITASMKDMGLIFPVSSRHLFGYHSVNARSCPITAKEVYEHGKKQENKKQKSHLPCPAWTEEEAELRAEQINFLLDFYTAIGMMPIFLNIAGRSEALKTQLVYDRLKTENIALSMWNLFHLQFFNSKRELRTVEQVLHMSIVFDEFRDKLKELGALTEDASAQTETFEDIFLVKYASSTAQSKLQRITLIENYRRGREKKRIGDDIRWIKRYNELKAFKAANRHCKVPLNSAGDTKLWTKELANWVKYNRNDNPPKAGSEHRKLLDEIGFVFDLTATFLATRPNLRKTIKKYSGTNTCSQGICVICNDRKKKTGFVCNCCTHPTKTERGTQTWICDKQACYDAHTEICKET